MHNFVFFVWDNHFATSTSAMRFMAGAACLLEFLISFSACAMALSHNLYQINIGEQANAVFRYLCNSFEELCQNSCGR
jgi:hypothetical protein